MITLKPIMWFEQYHSADTFWPDLSFEHQEQWDGNKLELYNSCNTRQIWNWLYLVILEALICGFNYEVRFVFHKSSQGVFVLFIIVFMHIYTDDIIIDVTFVFTIMEKFTILYTICGYYKQSAPSSKTWFNVGLVWPDFIQFAVCSSAANFEHTSTCIF